MSNEPTIQRSEADATGQQLGKMLLEMGPKLDRDLVREFRFAAALRLDAAA